MNWPGVRSQVLHGLGDPIPCHAWQLLPRDGGTLKELRSGGHWIHRERTARLGGRKGDALHSSSNLEGVCRRGQSRYSSTFRNDLWMLYCVSSLHYCHPTSLCVKQASAALRSKDLSLTYHLGLGLNPHHKKVGDGAPRAGSKCSKC